jgi:hypothetical protein
MVSLQKFPFKIIFVLGFFDLFHAIAFMIPTYDTKSDDLICKVQAIILHFFTTASILWTSFIALSLYLIIVKSSSIPQRYFKFFLISVLLISLGSSIVPYLTNTYGIVAGWCWIRQNSEINLMFYERYFLFFIPLWLSIIINTTLFILVSRNVSKSNLNTKISISLNKKLRFYPIILVICFLPYTVKSICELLETSYCLEHQLEFTITAGVFRAIIGLLNAIIYGFTQRVRKSLKVLFSRPRKTEEEVLIQLS